MFTYVSAPVVIGMVVGVLCSVRWRGVGIIFGWAIGLGMGILTLTTVIVVLMLDLWLIGGVLLKADTAKPFFALVYWPCCALGAVVTVVVVRAISRRREPRLVSS